MRGPIVPSIAPPASEERRLAFGAVGAPGLHALLFFLAAYPPRQARASVRIEEARAPLQIEVTERMGDEPEGALGPLTPSTEPLTPPASEEPIVKASRSPSVAAAPLTPVVASEASSAPDIVSIASAPPRAAPIPSNSRAAQLIGDHEGAGSGGGGRGLFGGGRGAGRGPGAFLARVCEISRTTRALAQIEHCKYVYEQRIDRIDVPQQRFENGFPGLPNLMEYFAVDIRGAFTVSEAGTYRFRLKSDDGAQLFIDDELIIDHDGVHDATSKRGEVELMEGRHQLRVWYFQGMKYELALQLFVTVPGGIEELFTPTL